MTDDQEADDGPPVSLTVSEVLATTRSGALDSLRTIRRYLARSLLAFAYRVGLPTNLGTPRQFDAPALETFMIVLAVVEVILIACCLWIGGFCTRPLLAAYRDQPRDDRAEDHYLDAYLVGFLLVFSLKSTIQMAGLICLCLFATQIYVMGETGRSSANLAVVAVRYVACWPTAGRRDRWAGRMSLAGWNRAIPSEFPG